MVVNKLENRKHQIHMTT